MGTELISSGIGEHSGWFGVPLADSMAIGDCKYISIVGMDFMGIRAVADMMENGDCNRWRLAMREDDRVMQSVAKTANYPAGVVQHPKEISQS